LGLDLHQRLGRLPHQHCVFDTIGDDLPPHDVITGGAASVADWWQAYDLRLQLEAAR
jgi:hypothetical protein